MFKWLRKRFNDWLLQEPYIDVISRSINGTPLTQLVTPRSLTGGGWRIEATPECQKGAVIKFAIQSDIGSNLSYAVDALEGKLDNLFCQNDLDMIASKIETVVQKKGYRAFKHNGKPHMEFVDYSLDPRDLKKLKQALVDYNFRMDTTKQKS